MQFKDGIHLGSMKHQIIVLLINLIAQNIQTQESTLLSINNDSAQIELSSVNIEIQVIGNMASTVTTLNFYNPNDRILEGELNFPLAEGQTVHRFAMDVNGKLREGVVVEKTHGRKAFEGVVRQVIDPGLLEQTVGNNYKTRVYPIPAKGYKTVLIGYEEELLKSPLKYTLLVDYGKVKEFSVDIKVVGQDIQPIINQNNLSDIDFEIRKESSRAQIHKNNFHARGLLSFELPSIQKQKTYRQASKGNDYFYVNIQPEIENITKKLPSSLAILWDVSKSAENRDIKKELNLLKRYLTKISDTDVRLVTFSNDIHEDLNFTVRNAKFNKLINHIEHLVFDGGTSYNCLDLENIEAEEILLFTDAISNLDALVEIKNTPPIQLISTSQSIDANLARFITENTGGNFVNLLHSDVKEALKQITNIPYQFLGVSFDENIIQEVYPNSPQNLNSSYFTLAGRIQSNKSKTLKLHFGISNKVYKTINIRIPKKSSSENLDRLWAKKKVNELLKNPQHDDKNVIQIGKEYSLVTPYTSLIVLDRVEDYVTYEIEPPSELMEEYNHLVALKDEDYIIPMKEIIAKVLDDYQERISWWRDDIKGIEKTNQINKNSSQTTDDNNDERQDQGPIENENVETEVDQDPEEDLAIIADTLVNSEISIQDINYDIAQITPTEVDTAIFNRVIEGEVFDYYEVPFDGATDQFRRTDFAFSQTTIKGKITKEATGDAVLFATIALYKDNYLIAGAESDFDGNYSFSNIDPATYDIEVSFLGLQTQRITGGIAKAGMMNIADFVMKEESVLVDVVEIVEFAVPLVEMSNTAATVNVQSLKGVSSGVQVTTVGVSKESVEMDKMESEIELTEWIPDEPYIDSLKVTPSERQYKMYLQLRDQYGNAPGFYLVVGYFFIQNNKPKDGYRVLSNIAELNLENHELLKTLAHSYLQAGKLKTSIFLFEKIVKLRPDEPQSKRDLAIAYQENHEYQKALDIFYEILITEWDDSEERFYKILSTVLFEMNNLITRKSNLDISNIDKDLIIEMPVDMRIVLNWNSLETDLDLWVTEPTGEMCYYNNELTKLGGRFTQDYTDGYGPEEYILKDAVEGEFNIQVKFYDDRVQKISGPVTLQVSIFTNYGTPNQKVQRLTRELSEAKDIIDIGTFNWSDN